MAVARTHARYRSSTFGTERLAGLAALPGRSRSPSPLPHTTQHTMTQTPVPVSPAAPSPIPASRARPEPRRSLPPKVRHRAGGRPVVFVPCRPHGCLPVCCLGVCCSGRLALACSGFKRNAFRPLPLSSAPLDPPIATSSDPPHDWGWTN